MWCRRHQRYELYQQTADEGREEAKEWLKEHSAEIEKKESAIMTKDEFYELIKKHYDIVRDKKRFNALLHDYFPREEEWRFNALLFLYDNGIMEELENNPMMDQVGRLRFKNKLKSAYGIKDTYAEWAVKAWVEGFGKWALEQKEWENKIGEYSNWELKDFDGEKLRDCVLNALIYPRVLRKLYLLWPLYKKIGEVESFKSFIWFQFDKKSNCDYEDYFELFNNLLRLKWSGGYILYGFFLLWGVDVGRESFKIFIKQDVEKGFKWIAYFYEQLCTKEYCHLWTKENENFPISYDIGVIVALLGMEYAEGKYIEKDMKKATKCFTKVFNMEASQWSDRNVAGIVMSNIGSAFTGEETSLICHSELENEKYSEFTITYKIRKNMKRAYQFLSKAVEYGNVNALVKLARMYENGKYVKKDIKYATELCQQAAEQGDDDAKEWLKDHHIEIEGIDSND